MTEAELTALIGYMESGVVAAFHMFFGAITLLVLVMTATFIAGALTYLYKRILNLAHLWY